MQMGRPVVAQVVSNYKPGLLEDIKNAEVLVFLSLETNSCVDPSYKVLISDQAISSLVAMHKQPKEGGV